LAAGQFLDAALFKAAETDDIKDRADAAGDTGLFDVPLPIELCLPRALRRQSQQCQSGQC
jgi:hypothetical protein